MFFFNTEILQLPFCLITALPKELNILHPDSISLSPEPSNQVARSVQTIFLLQNKYSWTEYNAEKAGKEHRAMRM